jgi:hypothetical protein
MDDPVDLFTVDPAARYFEATGWGTAVRDSRPRFAHLPSVDAQVVLMDSGSLGAHPMSLCAEPLSAWTAEGEVPTCAACRRIAEHYR